MKQDPHKKLKYQITSEKSFLDRLHHNTPEVEANILKIYCELREDKDNPLKKLNELILKYPKVPEYKGLLSKIYMLKEEEELAFAVIDWLEREHPEYLFGKFELAYSLMLEGKTEKVPEILGKAMEISQFCPQRKEFHLREVLEFNSVCIHYFLEMGNTLEAERRLALMEEIDEDSFQTKSARLDLLTHYVKTQEKNSGRAMF